MMVSRVLLYCLLFCPHLPPKVSILLGLFPKTSLLWIRLRTSYSSLVPTFLVCLLVKSVSLVLLPSVTPPPYRVVQSSLTFFGSTDPTHPLPFSLYLTFPSPVFGVVHPPTSGIIFHPKIKFTLPFCNLPPYLHIS